MTRIRYPYRCPRVRMCAQCPLPYARGTVNGACLQVNYHKVVSSVHPGNPSVKCVDLPPDRSVPRVKERFHTVQEDDKTLAAQRCYDGNPTYARFTGMVHVDQGYQHLLKE